MKIKYINKKIMAGLMAGTMVLSVAGCGKYSETELGGYYLTGSYSFSELGMVNVYIESKDALAFTVILKVVYTEDRYLGGYEILTDARYELEQEDIVTSFSLQDYLLSKNLLKDTYCENDFEKIYSMVNEEYIVDGKINKEKINVKK